MQMGRKILPLTDIKDTHYYYPQWGVIAGDLDVGQLKENVRNSSVFQIVGCVPLANYS